MYLTGGSPCIYWCVCVSGCENSYIADTCTTTLILLLCVGFVLSFSFTSLLFYFLLYSGESAYLAYFLARKQPLVHFSSSFFLYPSPNKRTYIAIAYPKTSCLYMKLRTRFVNVKNLLF